MKKPDRRQAMAQLIQTIRSKLPFEQPDIYYCHADCKGCSLKLMEYLDMELINWEKRLQDGEWPSFGDINQLLKTSKKVANVLKRNQLL